MIMKKIFSLLSLALLTTSAWAAIPSVEVPTLAQANALEDNESFAFNGNAVVTVYKSGYLFLRDESGFGQIRAVNGGEFVNGQVLSEGWSATKTGNDCWAWFTDAEGLSASGETNAELAEPITLTSFPDESMLNAYVRIENLAPSFFPSQSFKLPDGSSITKTESLWAGNADATTGNYNVYGVLVKVGGKIMINLTKYEDYVEPPTVLRGDVNKDKSVSIGDVTALIDYLLSGDDTGISLENADCNLDENVSIGDVTALIDYLLSGTWPEEEMVYTVAGTESVFGSNWDPTDENNNMVKGAGGIYTWTKTGVALDGNFEFKIVGDHDWSIYEFPIGMDNNYVVDVAEEGIYTIVITFNPEAAEADRITCTLTRTGDIEHVYTVAGTYNLFEADWDPSYEGNNMVKGDDGIYRLHKAGYFAEGTEIKFKVVQDHSWDHAWPAEDWLLYIPESGAWDFIIKFMPYNNDEDKIAVEVTKVF